MFKQSKYFYFVVKPITVEIVIIININAGTYVAYTFRAVYRYIK